MYLNPGVCLVVAFGGVRKAARAVGRTPGAVINWKKTGIIPVKIQRLVLSMVHDKSIDLTAEELIMGRNLP